MSKSTPSSSNTHKLKRLWHKLSQSFNSQGHCLSMSRTKWPAAARIQCAGNL